jgi:hypothetical protein
VIGAGAGASVQADGLAISPALPWQEATMLLQPAAPYGLTEMKMPTGTTSQPPDPPPTLRA